MAEIRGRDVPRRACMEGSGSRKRNLALVLEVLSGIMGRGKEDPVVALQFVPMVFQRYLTVA